MRKFKLPQSCPHRPVIGPKAGRCSALLRFHYIHLSQPEVAGADEGGLGSWEPQDFQSHGGPGFTCCEMDYGTLSLLQPSNCHAHPRSFLISSAVCSELWPSGGLKVYLWSFAESGKETLGPWETRQANGNNTKNCRQVVAGNVVGVDVYLGRLRNKWGRERVQEWAPSRWCWLSWSVLGSARERVSEKVKYSEGGTKS